MECSFFCLMQAALIVFLIKKKKRALEPPSSLISFLRKLGITADLWNPRPSFQTLP